MRPTLLALSIFCLFMPARAEAPSPVKLAELSARTSAAGIAAADPVLILSAAKLRKALAQVRSDRAAIGVAVGDGEPMGRE